MIRICNWNLSHRTDKILGEKEPLDIKDKTHGLCEECQVIFENKAEQERRKETDE